MPQTAEAALIDAMPGPAAVCAREAGLWRVQRANPGAAAALGPAGTPLPGRLPRIADAALAQGAPREGRLRGRSARIAPAGAGVLLTLGPEPERPCAPHDQKAVEGLGDLAPHAERPVRSEGAGAPRSTRPGAEAAASSDAPREAAATRPPAEAGPCEAAAFRAAVEAHALLAELDAGGRVVSVNLRLGALLGLESGGPAERALQAALRAPEARALVEDGGAARRAELSLPAADGRELRLEVEAAPLGRRGGRLLLGFDVTERHRAAEELARDARRLARAAELGGVGAWEYDVAADRLAGDPVARAIVGLTEPAPLNRMEARALCVGEARPALARAVAVCLRDGAPFELEAPFRRVDGRTLWLRITGEAAERGPQGLTRVVGALQDVTARKLRELELARMRARFQALFDNADSVIFLKRRDGRLLLVNRRYLEDAGLESVEGLTDVEIFGPEVGAALRAVDERVFVTGEPFRGEERLVAADGREITYLTSKFLIDDPELGEPVLCGVAADITEQKRRERALDRARERFRRVFDNVEAVMSIKTREGRYLAVNAEYKRALGRDDIEGRSVGELHPPDAAARIMETDRRIFESGQPARVEEATLEADGRRHTMIGSKFLIPDPDLDDMVLCAVGFDITEQKELQARLEESRRAAEAATQVKSRFLATMSHEIRTPMNGVLGMVELLSLRIDDPEQRRMLEVVRDSGRSLMALLNDILDFSKTESGRMTLERVAFSPAELARRAGATHRSSAEARGLGFDMALDAAAEAPRLGDPHRIGQILHNLLSNAVKFTERGGVRLAVAAEPEALRFKVEDDGVGMSEAEAAAVFDEFAQADSSVTRRFGGTGLGLAIIRGLVGAMGGRVTLDTAPGRGSRFEVRLPAPPALDADAAPASTSASSASASATPSAQRPATGLSVLIADDNEVNREVAVALLESLGAEAVAVADGAGAAAAAAARRFDLALIDIAMPGLDGVATLNRLRARERAQGAPPIPALAFSANAMAHQVDGYLAAGFDGHLPKPVDRAMLAAALARHVRPSRAA